VIRRRTRGFSLLEVTVVLGIILVASLIVIPKLTSTNSSSSDAATQTSIDSAMSSAVSLLNTTGRFSVDPLVLGSTLDPDLTLVSPSTPSVDFKHVSSGISTDGSSVAFAALSKSGVCWFEFRSLGSTDGILASSFGYHPKTVSTSTCTASLALTSLNAIPSTSAGGGWGHPALLP